MSTDPVIPDGAEQAPLLLYSVPLQLAELVDAGKLTRFDVAFAQMLRRHSGLPGTEAHPGGRAHADSEADAAAADQLAFVAALVCARSGRQDVFVDLARMQEEDPLELGPSVRYPDADTLLSVLRRTPVVGCADAGAVDVGDVSAHPMVLLGTRVYLARQFEHEQSLAAALIARAAAPVAWTANPSSQKLRDTDEQPEDTSSNVRAALQAFFVSIAGEDVNWQRVAAAMTLTRGLTVITGGPGTGKTTTVTRALVLLAQLQPELRIALAAPTGKAAARLGEAVRKAKSELQRTLTPAAARALERVPEQGTTLHRLLGYSPVANRFRFNATHLLPVDVLVIDEASMLDLRLARAALSALPAAARLLLVGDKDQLSSVDAGMVLGDLCAGLSTRFDAARFSSVAAQTLSTLTGQDLRHLAAPQVPPMADCLAWLRVSHRFQAGGAIAQLAEAINAGDMAGVQAAQMRAQVLQHAPDQRAVVELARTHYRPMRQMAQAGDAVGALAALNSFRVLCAVREGRDGVLELNRAVAAALGDARAFQPVAALAAREAMLYAGLPLIITRNEPRSDLFNGDVGVVVQQEDGSLRVAFPGIGDPGTEAATTADAASTGAVRLLAPSRLPGWEPVYAMTIHKSQGSEFDGVAVVLPRSPSANEARLLTRELVYTAVTRARSRVHLFATPAVLALAVAAQTHRASGLRDLLWASPER